MAIWMLNMILRVLEEEGYDTSSFPQNIYFPKKNNLEEEK